MRTWIIVYVDQREDELEEEDSAFYQRRVSRKNLYTMTVQSEGNEAAEATEICCG